MKKNIKIASLLIFSISIFSFLAYSMALPSKAETTCDGEVISGVCIPAVSGLAGQDSDTPVEDVILAVLDWILGIAGVLSMLIIVAGGFRYIVSAGDEDQTKAAKGMITNGIIGLVVVLVAFAIVTTISNVLAEESCWDPTGILC